MIQRCALELTHAGVRRRLGWLPRDARLIFVRKPTEYGWRTDWFALLLWDEGQFITVPVLSQSVLTSGTGVQTFDFSVSASDWNDASNTIEVIAGGGSGGAFSGGSKTTACGGGASCYMGITNFSRANCNLGSNQSQYQIGQGGAAITVTAANSAGATGTDGWFNSATFPGAGADNTKVGAQHGSGGNVANNAASNGGTAGATASSWGTSANNHNGGRGGNATAANVLTATGGGGAGGPTAAGAQGVDSAANAATNGGQGDVAVGGTAGASPGGDGGAGTEIWNSNSGSGGGGAGRTGSTTRAGNGGLYGAGGGGSTQGASGLTISGAGSNGIIVLTWTPAAVSFLPSNWIDIDRRQAITSY